MDTTRFRHARTDTLDIAYLESGPAAGAPVLLMHGFPYDVHAYAEVAPLLAAQGCRVIVPYLRGYGPTRFLSDTTPRSGEQAAIGADLIALMDALSIERALVAGYDWGGRAACVAAALWPERCTGLVTANGYAIQNIARAMEPLSPEMEARLWYQYYFHSERGRNGLARDRRAICRTLWRMWSPDWRFDDATFERSARSFDNPDFVDVVIHSYKHRFGLVPGAPEYAALEARLAAQPKISVPTVILEGGASGIYNVGGPGKDAAMFTGPRQHRVLEGTGHNMPQEAPKGFAEAVMALIHIDNV
jgi:pimeloyl-ACP methyl ester carboxylesterase